MNVAAEVEVERRIRTRIAAGVPVAPGLFDALPITPEEEQERKDRLKRFAESAGANPLPLWSPESRAWLKDSIGTPAMEAMLGRDYAALWLQTAPGHPIPKEMEPENPRPTDTSSEQ